jgi:hypothetical protein
LRDLRRDDRYALHCETFPPPRHDDAFYIAGVAPEVPDRSVWDRVAAQMLAERDTTEQWPGFEEMVLFQLSLDRCLLTLTQANDTFPAGHTIWHAPPGPEAALSTSFGFGGMNAALSCWPFHAVKTSLAVACGLDACPRDEGDHGR